MCLFSVFVRGAIGLSVGSSCWERQVYTQSNQGSKCCITVIIIGCTMVFVRLYLSRNSSFFVLTSRKDVSAYLAYRF